MRSQKLSIFSTVLYDEVVLYWMYILTNEWQDVYPCISRWPLLKMYQCTGGHDVTQVLTYFTMWLSNKSLSTTIIKCWWFIRSGSVSKNMYYARIHCQTPDKDGSESKEHDFLAASKKVICIKMKDFMVGHYFSAGLLKNPKAIFSCFMSGSLRLNKL